MTTQSPEQTNGAAQTNGAPQAAKPKSEAMVPTDGGAINAFASERNFDQAIRMAKAFAASTLVPEAYRNNIPNVLIAMELASRINASIFAVVQNMDIIHGRPSLRSTFLIATVNSSGRFTPLRFRFSGKEGTPSWGCRAVAKERESGEECVGALITMKLAADEGWTKKSGSKWLTMPEQMMMYRAAGFWTRVYAPELSLGMQTEQEVIDTTGYDATAIPTVIHPGSLQDLETQLRADAKPSAPTPPPSSPTVDPQTGEVTGETGRQPGED